MNKTSTYEYNANMSLAHIKMGSSASPRRFTAQSYPITSWIQVLQRRLAAADELYPYSSRLTVTWTLAGLQLRASCAYATTSGDRPLLPAA
jgi:hypothetical protein